MLRFICFLQCRQVRSSDLHAWRSERPEIALFLTSVKFAASVTQGSERQFAARRLNGRSAERVCENSAFEKLLGTTFFNRNTFLTHSEHLSSYALIAGRCSRAICPNRLFTQPLRVAVIRCAENAARCTNARSGEAAPAKLVFVTKVGFGPSATVKSLIAGVMLHRLR